MTRLHSTQRMDFSPAKVLRILDELTLQPHAVTHFRQLTNGKGVGILPTRLNGIRLGGRIHADGFYDQVAFLTGIPSIQVLLSVGIIQVYKDMQVTIGFVSYDFDAPENPHTGLDHSKADWVIDVRNLVANGAG